MVRTSVYQDLVGKLEKRLSVLGENSLLPSEQKLADEYGVSKPTLRRALKVMTESGYVRKINGVGVMVNKAPKVITRELIFLCHDIVFFAKSLKGFSAVSAESNYMTSVVPLAGDSRTQERIIESVASRKPSGVVVYADPREGRLDAFHKLAAVGIPTVYMMRLPQGIDSNLLWFGNADGMIGIVKRLYDEGCRRIAFYGDENVNPVAAIEREEGFLSGLKKVRLHPRDEFMCNPAMSRKGRQEFFCLLANKEERPDAVCCLNDHCAGNLIKRLIGAGGDISGIRFAGFDNSSLAEFLPVSLLTAEPPMEKLGCVAAEMLIRHIENPGLNFHKQKLKTKVVQVG